MAREKYPHYGKILLCASSKFIDQWRLEDMPNSWNSFASDNKKQHFKFLARWGIWLTGTHFVNLPPQSSVFTKILQSSLKISSFKPQALLMFNVIWNTSSQSFIKNCLTVCDCFIHVHKRLLIHSRIFTAAWPPRVKFAALIVKLPLHYNQLWDTTQTWWRAEIKRGNQNLNWIYSFLTDIHWITLLKTGWRTSWQRK